MKAGRFWLLAAVVLAFSLFLNCHYAQAKGEAVEIDLSKPDQSEVLEEVSKFTGLTKDVVELVNEEQAELFKGLDNTVFALKVVSLITEAKDTEALTEIGTKALEIVKDALVKEAFPAAVGTFFTVASVSKATLEIVRDYYWIPKNEEAIYQAYKEFRTEDRKWTKRVVKEETGRDIDEDKAEDTSVEGMNRAFDYAPFGKAYRPVREKMFDKMLEAKADTMTTSEGIKIKRKMDKDQMGPVVIADYEKKIDDFWISRMEMRYKKERMKERQAELIKEIWEKKAQQLEALKAAAGKMAGPERFFLTDKDIPQGWKRQPSVHSENDFKITFRPLRPEVSATDGVTSQHFDLVNSSFIAGLEERKWPNGGVYYVYPKDYRRVDVSEISIDVAIEPRVQQGYGGTVEITADNVRQGGFTTGRQATGEFFGEGIEVGAVAKDEDKANILYECVFLKGKWFVTVSAGSRSASERATVAQRQHIPDNYVDKTTASGELVRMLAQAVARKIPGGQEKQEEAKAGKKKQK